MFLEKNDTFGNGQGQIGKKKKIQSRYRKIHKNMLHNTFFNRLYIM